MKVQRLHCWMESWYITIQGIHTPIPQRVEFFRFPAPQCTGESNSHWVVPCEVHCDQNSSGECWRRWVGACPLHCCQGRRRDCPIRCGRNAHELEQHNARWTSKSSIVQVFTLDRDGCWVREPVAEPNSTIAHALSGLINSEHNNRNTYCNPTHGHVKCHGIRKSSSGEQQQENCSST